MTVFGPLVTAPITWVSLSQELGKRNTCCSTQKYRHVFNGPVTQSPMVHKTNSCISCSKTICKTTRNCTHKKKTSCSIYQKGSQHRYPTHISTIASPFFFWTTCKSIYRHRWDLLKSCIPHLSMFSWRFSQFFTWFPSAWKKNIARKIAREIPHFPGKGLSSSRKQRNLTQIFNRFCL